MSLEAALCGKGQDLRCTIVFFPDLKATDEQFRGQGTLGDSYQGHVSSQRGEGFLIT